MHSASVFYDNLFRLAVSSGLRVGELTALTLEDIEFKRRVILVNITLSILLTGGWHFEVAPPKTKASYREVPLNAYSENAILEQIAQREKVLKKHQNLSSEFGNLLFVSTTGTPVYFGVLNRSISTVVRHINKDRKVLGDQEKFEKFTMQTFRHTFATRRFENGIQPRTVQAYLGHSNFDITMNLYAHVLPEQTKSEMDKFKLDLLMNNIEEPTLV